MVSIITEVDKMNNDKLPNPYCTSLDLDHKKSQHTYKKSLPLCVQYSSIEMTFTLKSEQFPLCRVTVRCQRQAVDPMIVDRSVFYEHQLTHYTALSY